MNERYFNETYIKPLGKTYAFTMVELIIVITILAILATISFISFKEYLGNTRDSNRLTTLNNLENGLKLYQLKVGNYLMPDDKVDITASGNIIGYQGNIGDNIYKGINMSSLPLDPLDNSKYIYSVNANKTKYQLMTYMEGMEYLSYISPYVDTTFAQDFTTRKIKSTGFNIGIFLNTDNSLPTTNINALTGTTNYKVVFLNNSYIMTGNILSVINTFRGEPSLYNIEDNLVGYWDMKTLIDVDTGNAYTGGSNWKAIKDFSKYNNHLGCLGSGSGDIVYCGDSKGPKFIDGGGVEFSKSNGGRVTGTIGNQKFWQIIPGVKATDNNNHAGETTIVVSFKKNSLGTGSILGDSNVNESSIYTTSSGELVVAGSYGGSVIFSQYAIGTKYVVAQRIKNLGGGTYGYMNREYAVYFNDKFYYENTTTCTDSLCGPDSYLRIGSGDIPDWTLDGIIYEVRIYNEALSDNQIKAIYDAMK